LRIGVVSSVVTPLTPAHLGGAQALVVDLAWALVARGHHVRVFCAEGSDLPGLEMATVPMPASAARALVRPGRLPRRRPPDPDVYRAFASLFELVRAYRPDAVSQHAFDAEALDLAGPKGVVHTLHLPPLVPGVVEAARRCRARLVTVSRACRRTWMEAGVREIGLIRNGVSDYPPAPHRQPIDEVALVAGRISPEKGTHVAIRVGRRAGLQPLVAGAVYDRDYFRREVRPLGAHVLGPLPRSDLRAMMARARVTLMPISWPEPFGLVAAESQMAGCPVAGYRLGGLPEVVAERVGGYLVEAGDENRLVEAVEAAGRLDRAAVRRSARRRLLIGAAARRYERALESVA
jgi:glycosyltransferase involved in cell wall biosynthesis